MNDQQAVARSAQVANGFTHFLRARGAVQPERDDLRVGVDGGPGGGDIRADQHRPRRFDRNGAQHGNMPVLFDHRIRSRHDGRLGLQDVLARFDQQRINPAVEQASHLLGVAVHEGVPRGLQERRQLRPGSDRADHESRVRRLGELGTGFAGDLGGSLVDLIGLVCDSEFGKADLVGPERVGLDGVTTHRQKGMMNVAHDVGPSQHRHLGAVLQPVVIRKRQVALLHARAHGPVKHEHALANGFKKQ